MNRQRTRRIVCPACRRPHFLDVDDVPGIVVCECTAELRLMSTWAAPAPLSFDVRDQLKEPPR